MAEHDQRFKRLLREFFPEFLTLFFPRHADGLDLSSVEWLDKELFAAALQGEVHILDLVARLRRRTAGASGAPAELLAIVHIEVESREAVAAFRPRMYHYYEYLRRTHDCPVLPVAVYLRVGLDGVGVETYVETFDDLEVLRFRYLYVGLPALEAEPYAAGANWLGVALAALMRVANADRPRLRAEAVRRVLVECQENDYRRLLLMECIEAYLTLDEQQQHEYDQLLRMPPYQEVMPMMTTTFEKGIAKGLEEGIAKGMQQGKEQGQRRIVWRQMEKRFGPLSPVARQRLEEWPAERLEELSLALLDASSLRALGLED